LFVRVLGVGHKEGFELASKIHEEGSASVNFFDLANVREAEERLLSGGPDCGYPGSRASLAVSVVEESGGTTKVLSRGRVGPRGYEPLAEEHVGKLHEESQRLHGPAGRHVRLLACGPSPDCAAGAGLAVLVLVLSAMFIAMLAAR